MIRALLDEVRTFLDDLRKEFPGMFAPAGPQASPTPGAAPRHPRPPGRHAAATSPEAVSRRLAF